MDIHITNKKNKSWEVVYVIEKVSKHRVSKIVSSVWWRVVQKKKKCSALCCKVIDACTTSNHVNNWCSG